MVIPIVIQKLGFPILIGCGVIGVGFITLNIKSLMNVWKDDMFVVAQTLGDAAVKNSSDSTDGAGESTTFTTQSVYKDTDPASQENPKLQQRNYQCVITIKSDKRQAPDPEEKESKENCKLHKITVDKTNKKWMYARHIKIGDKKSSELPKLVANYNEEYELIASEEEKDVEITTDSLKNKNNYFLIQLPQTAHAQFFQESNAIIKIQDFESPKGLFGTLKRLFTIYQDRDYYGKTKYIVGKVHSIKQKYNSLDGPIKSFNSSQTKCSVLITSKIEEDPCEVYDFGDNPTNILDKYKKGNAQSTTITKDHFYLIKLTKSIDLGIYSNISVKTSDDSYATVIDNSTIIFSPDMPAKEASENDEFLFVIRELPVHQAQNS